MSYYPSVIARPTDTGFEGRYVHSAGTPDWVIGLLSRLYHGPFDRDLDAMQKFMVDEHPAGWSQLGDDPTVDTGWDNNRQHSMCEGFVCYCHGDRHEADLLFTPDSDTLSVDYLYVLGTCGIDVHRADWDNAEEDDVDTPPEWKHHMHVCWVDNAVSSTPAGTIAAVQGAIR